MGAKQGGNAGVKILAEAAQSLREHEFDRAQLVRDGQTMRRHEARNQVQWRRQPVGLQREFTREDQLQRHAQKQRVRIRTRESNHAQGFAISAKQNMLPVVQLDAVQRDSPGPPSSDPGSFEHVNRNTG